MERILVVGPAWVGDMVLAQSLFKTLKLQQPGIIIDVAAPAWTLPLLARMPEVNEAIALPFRHGQFALRERLRFGKSLKARAYNRAIVLPNSLKSALLPWAAAIPHRTGFVGEWRYGLLNDVRRLDRQALPRTLDRFVALGLARDQALPPVLPQPSLAAKPDLALQALRRLGYDNSTTPVLGLCPGAEYGEAKRWPAEYYAEVATAALEKGWQVWLFGSEKDATVTTRIDTLTGKRCLDLGGRTTLGEAIDLMALTSAVVSNDSGLMHVAAALDKPLVAIYGSSDPHHTPPMSPQAVILYLALECSPCFQRQCPLTHLNCLRQLQPAQIVSQIPFHKNIKESN